MTASLGVEFQRTLPLHHAIIMPAINLTPFSQIVHSYLSDFIVSEKDGLRMIGISTFS